MKGLRWLTIGFVLGICIPPELASGSPPQKPQDKEAVPREAGVPKFVRRDLREPKGWYAVTTDGGRTLAASLSAAGNPMETVIRFLDLTGKQPPADLAIKNVMTGKFACSADGKTVAIGVRGNKIELWDRTAGELKKALEGHTDPVTHLSFSPNGLMLVSSTSNNSGGSDGRVILWDVATGAKLAVVSEGSGSFLSLFSLDGKTIVFGGSRAENTVHLWDVEAKKVRHTLKTDFTTPFHCAAFSQDGKTLVTGSSLRGGKKNPDRKRMLKLWDVEKGTLIREWKLEATTNALWAAAFSPDGKLLASCGGREVIIWNPENGKQIAILNGGWDQSFSVAFSADGLTLAAAGSGKGVIVWDVETGK